MDGQSKLKNSYLPITWWGLVIINCFAYPISFRDWVKMWCGFHASWDPHSRIILSKKECYAWTLTIKQCIILKDFFSARDKYFTESFKIILFKVSLNYPNTKVDQISLSRNSNMSNENQDDKKNSHFLDKNNVYFLSLFTCQKCAKILFKLLFTLYA